MGAGQRIVLPALDEKLVMLMATYHLTPPEMVRFLKLFRKLDKSKSQMVDLDDFFKFLDIERSDYTDSLLDMLNIDYHESGEINFRDFLIYVVTYGFFETADILKFCLQIFDQDKNGFFANDEFQTLMRIIYKLAPNENFEGQAKISWNRLHVPEDDRYDFQQLLNVHRRFPKLFQPAFTLQDTMMKKIMGESWWQKKKYYVADLRDEEIKAQRAEEARLERQARDMMERKVKRKMGLIRYYCCPIFRHLFEPQNDNEQDVESEEDEEEKKLREKERELARREEELRVKNPETAQWRQYKQKQERKAKKAGTENVDKVIKEKFVRTERSRASRGEDRAERRKQRKGNPDLKYKPTTVLDAALVRS